MALEQMCALLNAATVYRWYHHDDSAWYLEYLSCRPDERTRFRIHNLEECDEAGPLLSAQLDAEREIQGEADTTFRGALALLPIRDLRERETYD